MGTYKVVYWTEPTSFTGGNEIIEYITAKNRSDACTRAEEKHPGWAVEQITFHSSPYADWDSAMAEI